MTVDLAGGTYVAEMGWITNAAGYHFHNWYGFGGVDVDSAVLMARDWIQGGLGTFQDTGWLVSLAPGAAIPDASADGATASITIPETVTNLTIEAVQIEVGVTHTALGDLGYELVGPSGTKSILTNIRNGYGKASGTFSPQMLTNAFYGEKMQGTWTLRVVDGLTGNVGTLNSFKIRIFGH